MHCGNLRGKRTEQEQLRRFACLDVKIPKKRRNLCESDEEIELELVTDDSESDYEVVPKKRRNSQSKTSGSENLLEMCMLSPTENLKVSKA